MAFVEIHEMDFTGKNFSAIISGQPGVGKSTLALSAPDALLVDFDKGISRVKAQHRKTTLQCSGYGEFLEDLQSPEMARFKTIIVDTGGSLITAMGQWAIAQNPKNGNGSGGVGMKGYGVIKTEFQRLTNYLKEVANKNVIYIFHTVEERTKVGRDEVIAQRLMCDGSAKTLVWQSVDLGAYYYIDGNNRMLGFSPTELYQAKGTHGINGLLEVPYLDEKTPNTFLSDMFDKMQENLKAETEIFAEEKAKYAVAMEKGKETLANSHNADEFNLVADVLKLIDHALTSQTELRQLYANRAQELDLTYNKETKQFEEKIVMESADE